MSKLSPQDQFPHSKDSVHQILVQYGVSLKRYEPAKSGIENLTLIIWSGDQQYVLRVYRQHKKSDADIKLELDFMATLRDGGLPIPAILPSTTGNLLVVTELNGQQWQSVLMKHAAGSHPKSYSPHLIEDMAAIQANMHLIGHDYAKQHNIPSIRHQLAETYFTDALLSNPKTDPALQSILSRAQAFIVELDKTLPVGLSHFDYDADNLFADHTGHVTAVLDFDDTQCMPLVVCLGYTLWDIITSAESPDEQVACYIQIYQQTRPLSQAEKTILPAVILFRHYIITAIRIHFDNFSQADLDEALMWESRITELVLRF